MSVIGFDIGNETCYTAISRGGGIEVLDNEYSLRVTPLYAGFTKSSREVGIAARTKIIPNIENTVFNFKTILGKKYFEETAQKELSYLPYDSCELPSGDVGVKVKYLNKETLFSVEQIMATVFTKLITNAEVKTGVKVQDCVISVPVFFTDRQRRALLDAAEIAGLKTLQLENDVTAAALIYGFYRQNNFETDMKTVIFIDLGQSALTVTACKFHQGKLSILGSVWNTSVGGRDFDYVLVRHFSNEFKTKYHIDVTKNKKALMALLLECESLKKQMSANSRELEINIECIMNDMDVKGKMKRELFENLSSELLSKIERTMMDLISQTNLNCDDIESVQIIGGSSRIPAFKNLVFKVFGKEPQTTLNQDEAVARGCCLQCALLSPLLRTKPFQIEDIQPYSIKVVHKTENFEEKIPVFHRFQKIPSTKIITFRFKGLFILEVFYEEGTTGRATDIGKFQFSSIPEDVKDLTDAKVKIKVSLDNNGIFNINSARIIAKMTNNSEVCASNSETMIVVPYDESSASPTQNNLSESEKSEENSDVEVKDIIKSFELDFMSIFPKLSWEDKMDYVNKEKYMRENDLKAKRVADLRNDVEEYMYCVRGKLFNELSSFVSETHKFQFSEQLNEIENVLYESDDSFLESALIRHFQQLQKSFEPLQSKYSEVKNIIKVLNEFQTVLESSLKSFSNLSHKQAEIFNKLEEKWQVANEYVQSYLIPINEVKSSDELKITAAMIYQEMVSFKNFVDQAIFEAEKKIDEDTSTMPIGDNARKQSLEKGIDNNQNHEKRKSEIQN